MFLRRSAGLTSPYLQHKAIARIFGRGVWFFFFLLFPFSPPTLPFFLCFPFPFSSFLLFPPQIQPKGLGSTMSFPSEVWGGAATCPHCNGADKTAEHLVLQCPAHDQVRRNVWPGGKFNVDLDAYGTSSNTSGRVPPDREWEGGKRGRGGVKDQI